MANHPGPNQSADWRYLIIVQGDRSFRTVHNPFWLRLLDEHRHLCRAFRCFKLGFRHISALGRPWRAA